MPAPRDLGVVGGRGDRQHLADRLDPVATPVIVDEGDHVLDRRSRSPWGKYREAFRRISLAWRSSPTSRSGFLTRSRSALVGPGRAPLSRSACRTHFRSVSVVQPILPATELIAPHSVGGS